MTASDTFNILANKRHITFRFEEIRPQTWHLYVYCNGTIINLLESGNDNRDRRTILLDLFAWSNTSMEGQFDSTELDRLLFL